MGRAIANDLASAEQLAGDLLAKLTMIEERLMMIEDRFGQDLISFDDQTKFAGLIVDL